MSKDKYSALKEKIKGPVYPICPAFTKSFSIDYAKVAEYVEFLNSKDVRTIMITAGTSRFNLLSEDEIKQLNKVVVQANKGKAITIAANPMFGSTAKAIEFAQHAEEIGADCILIYYPERFYKNEYVFSYFENIARNSSIPILLHGIPMRNALSIGNPRKPFTLDLCAILSKVRNVIGLKEESANDQLRYQLAVHLKDKLSLIVSGGSMWMFMSCVLFGVQAYLVGVGSFAPEIEENFYKQILARNYDQAVDLITKYEEPFFDVAKPMGWHVAMKTAMSLLGLMPSFERSPLQSATDEELDRIKNVLIDMGLKSR